MMNWQKLLICNIPRDGGGGPDSNSGGDTQGYSVGDPSDDTPDTVGPNDPSPPGDPDAPSQNAFEAAFQGGIPGLGFGTSLSSALGPTSMGSFGLSGVTSNTSAPGTSTSFGGAVTDPGSVPGYEGPGPTVSGTQFDSMAPTVDLGPDFSSANSVLADPAVTSLSTEKVGVLTNVAPTYDQAALTTASQKAIDAALAGLVEAPAAIGINPSTTPTSAPSTIGSTTKSNDVTPSTTTPTADSSTTKGPTLDITGINLVDSFLSSFVNNPTAAITGLAVGAVNPVAGLVNTAIGNPIGFAADRALSSIAGKEPGYGQTSTSSTEPGTSTPSGPGPSTSDQGPSGSDSGGGGGIMSLAPTTTTPADTKTTPASTFVDYDLTKSPTVAPKYTYPDYGVYTAPKVTAPQGASFSNNYALQFPVIPKYPNLSNTNKGILDAFPV